MIYIEPETKPNGDRAVRVAFGDERSLEVNRPVRRLYQALQDKPPLGVTELVPTYASVTVIYDPGLVGYQELADRLRAPAGQAMEEGGGIGKGRLLEIPVCYQNEYAPDMDYISRQTSLRPERIVELHTAEPYHVFQLGFTPGCPFLGPLQEELYVPLMQLPRTTTPTGSVAISVGQTVIYPRATPGGMRLVGRTPVRLFQIDHPALSLFRPGDRVLVAPISPGRYRSLEKSCLNLMDGVTVKENGSPVQ